MARISTYDQDGTLNKLDKVLGTDSATGTTKNYTIESITGLINDESLVQVFDGVSYSFKDYETGSGSPEGIINLNAGVAVQAAFSSINQIYISVLDKFGNNISDYLDDTIDSFIRIVQKSDINIYGVLEVTAVADHDSGAYKLLTVTPRVNNGNIKVNEEYFISNYSAVFDQDFSDDSVTEFSDVTSAGSGQIITTAERTTLNNLDTNALLNSDVVDNVTSTDTDVPLSANQGKVLKGLIDSINTLLTSDNVDLDTLQEVVDFIEANKDSLDNLSISNIAGLQTALDAKEDSVAGKGLSTEDFTSTLLAKLNSIATNAEVNVQSDWAQSNTANDSFIQNKPTDITDLSSHNVTELLDVTNAGSGSIISSAERTKLAGIAAGAEVNVQADYNETDTNSDAYIQNKPTITVAGTTNEVEVSPTGAQNLPTTFTVGLPDDVTIGSDLTVNETIQLTNAQSSTPTFDNGIYYSTEDSHDTLHFRYHGHDLSIDYLTENIPTGILNGGELSTNTNTTFDIAAGDGIINILNKDAADPHPEIKKVTWSATTVTHTLGDAADTDQLNTWVYVDSTGAIQQTLTTPSPSLWRNNIVLGSVVHSENIIRFVKTFPRAAYSNGNTYAEFVEIFGPLKKSGHLLTVNSTNNMALDRAAGVSFALGRNYETDAEEPNLVSDSASTPVFHRYSSTSTGFTKDDGTGGAGYTDIDPTKYDNNGTLTTVSGGHYSVQRLYHFPNNTNVIVAYYGKDEYNSMDAAEKNYLLEDFQEADNTSQQAIYLGALIVKGSTTNLNTASDAKILTGGIFRSLAATNLGGVAADASLDDLSDVTITSVADDQLLQYNSSTGKWENTTFSGGASALNDLTDVSITSVANNQFIKYNSTSSEWENASIDSDDIPEGSTNSYYPSADATKVGHISVTQAVDLDTIESDTATNNAKVTFPGFGTTSGTALEGNTQFVDGTGTAGNIPKLSDSDTLTDSVISESGQVIDINTTGAIQVPDGTTAQRPGTPVAGMFRYNTTDSQFEGYTTEWGAIAGGGGTTNVVVDTKNGDGTTLAFNITNTIASENNVQVYIDGVYQTKDKYSTSGTTVTFGSGNAPATGTNNIEIVHFVQVNGTPSIEVDTFNGDGSTTGFTLTSEPATKNNLQVYIDGVYQAKTNYVASGTTLTFSTAPETGVNNIEVTHLKIS